MRNALQRNWWQSQKHGVPVHTCAKTRTKTSDLVHRNNTDLALNKHSALSAAGENRLFSWDWFLCANTRQTEFTRLKDCHHYYLKKRGKIHRRRVWSATLEYFHRHNKSIQPRSAALWPSAPCVHFLSNVTSLISTRGTCRPKVNTLGCVWVPHN